MAEDFVELGATALDHITNTKGWDRTWDVVTRANKKVGGTKAENKALRGKEGVERVKGREGADRKKENLRKGGFDNKGGKEDLNRRYLGREDLGSSSLGYRHSTGGVTRKRRVELPSPEREDGGYPFHGDQRDLGKVFGVEDPWELHSDRALELQSRNSDRVLRAYEDEIDDPRRVPDERFWSRGDYNYGKSGTAASSFDGAGIMSYAPAARPRSQPPRDRGYYSDEESDYDERSGRRYGGRNSGRGRGYGYEEHRDRGAPVDREIVEREVYRGPSRHSGPLGGYTPYAAAGTGAGAMAPYRRSAADLRQNPDRPRSSYGKRSKSRGRRSRSSSRSNSRSRSRSKSRWREKVDETFDTSWQGWGATVAGALIGGAAGRELGNGERHRRRDMVIGALVGGVGANVAENKWRDYRDEKREEERYGGSSGGGGGYRGREERDGGRYRPYEEREGGRLRPPYDERYERRGRSTGP